MGEGRREVAFPTSSGPPSDGKCKGCTPCKPVECSVTPKLQCPGSAKREDADAYPLLWKCECGNQIFDPYPHMAKLLD